MLIFNCSRPFAKFISSGAPRDSGSLVVRPRAANLRDEAVLLRQEHGWYADHILQWQCNVIEEQGRACVIAMEVDTRFAMTFTMLEPGRPDQFVSAFIERLLNLRWRVAEALELASGSESEAWLTNFLGAHRKSCFLLRTDRSVQAHVNDVARHFALELEMRGGAFPDGRRECAALDGLLNDRLCSSGERREYFRPDEAMLFHWLETYGGWTRGGLERVRTAMRERCRQPGRRMPDLAAGIA
jgi:hypothetical protein